MCPVDQLYGHRDILHGTGYPRGDLFGRHVVAAFGHALRDTSLVELGGLEVKVRQIDYVSLALGPWPLRRRQSCWGAKTRFRSRRIPRSTKAVHVSCRPMPGRPRSRGSDRPVPGYGPRRRRSAFANPVARDISCKTWFSRRRCRPPGPTAEVSFRLGILRSGLFARYEFSILESACRSNAAFVDPVQEPGARGAGFINYTRPRYVLRQLSTVPVGL